MLRWGSAYKHLTKINALSAHHPYSTSNERKCYGLATKPPSP